MSSEKGATYLDKLCHKFYDEPKGHGKKTDYVCRLCGGPLETYYCEERMYLVKCADCGTLALVRTTSPGVAAGVTLARPTLTPPNEPLTIEQLRKMDGEPVWVELYQAWALVEVKQDGSIMFYGNSFSCSYGRTWQVYRFRPGRCPLERQEDT